jgi:hypothetical protein
VSPQASIRLELFAAYATGLVVHVWAEDLMQHILVDRVEVFVALGAIVVVVVVGLVPLHVLLSSEMLVTAIVGAFDGHRWHSVCRDTLTGC